MVPRTDRWALAAIALLAAVALALRLRGLLDQPLWYDEIKTLWRSDLPTPFAVLLRNGHDNQAPLYDLMTWLLIQCFGKGELVSRLPPALFGAALVPATAALARVTAGNWSAALIAGGWVAVAPMLVRYGQEGRPYALFALLAAVTLVAAVRFLRSRGTQSARTLAVASTLLALVHYYGVLLFGAVALVLLLGAGRRALRVLLWPTLALLLWLPIGIKQFATQDYPEVYQRLTLPVLYEALTTWSIDGGARFRDGTPHAAPWFLLLAAIGALLLLRKAAKERSALLLPVALLLPFAGVAGVDLLGKVTFTARHSIFAAPLLATLAALALTSLRPRWLAWPALALLLVVGGRDSLHCDGIHRRPDLRGAARVLAAHPGAAPAAYPHWTAICVDYYAGLPWKTTFGRSGPDEWPPWTAQQGDFVLITSFNDPVETAAVRARLQATHDCTEAVALYGARCELWHRR